VREFGADGEAMWLEITGASAGEYLYSLYLEGGDAADPADARERHGGGATIDWEDGLVVLNPNRPSPSRDETPPDRSVPADSAESGPGQPAAGSADRQDGSVAERVARVLEEQINPEIASHGGRAELVSVEGEAAHLRLGGGCQGCGLAAMTLKEGIEGAITAAVPEIARVIDVTDHASGTEPWLAPGDEAAAMLASPTMSPGSG
jgi:Fe/S biogenesis protein NfuA